jgi:hypothetical protein
LTVTDVSGTFTDDGGVGAPYSSDVRSLTLFEPEGAAQVEFTFTQFDLETDWDYLYIYDGWSVFHALIGIYTGTDNPGTIVSTGESLLVEFRSDCSIGYSGWEASFTGQFPVGMENGNSLEFRAHPNPTTGIIILPQAENLSWKILDLKGRWIASGSRSSEINLESFNIQPQILILKMTNKNQTVNQRLIYSHN